MLVSKFSEVLRHLNNLPNDVKLSRSSTSPILRWKFEAKQPLLTQESIGKVFVRIFPCKFEDIFDYSFLPSDNAPTSIEFQAVLLKSIDSQQIHLTYVDAKMSSICKEVSLL